MLALLWLLTGCGESGEETLAAGEAEYRKFCSVCHGVDGSGRPPTFPPLNGSEWLAMGPEAVALVVLAGLKGEIEVAGRTYRGYMPPMTQLSDVEISAVLGYLDDSGWAAWAGIPDARRVSELRQYAESLQMFVGRADLEAALEGLNR